MNPATALLRVLLTSVTLTVLAAPVAAHNSGKREGYSSQVLVSNGSQPAPFTDPNLGNAWGIAFNPTGVVWVNNQGTGKSTLYDGNGVPQSLVVTVPGPAAGVPSNPSGIVFSGGADFVVTNGVRNGPARFIFATLEGSISGWAPNVDATQRTARGADYRRSRLHRARAGRQRHDSSAVRGELPHGSRRRLRRHIQARRSARRFSRSLAAKFATRRSAFRRSTATCT